MNFIDRDGNVRRLRLPVLTENHGDHRTARCPICEWVFADWNRPRNGAWWRLTKTIRRHIEIVHPESIVK